MSSATSVRQLEYTAPGALRPMDSARVRLVERGGLIGTLTLLVLVMPLLYKAGAVDIIVLNQLGRFLCYAIVAIGVDLIWGYCGILSLCQAMFFVLGGYAMGMHLALKGPLDGDGIPRALYVVTSIEGFQLPSFWKPFQTLPVTVLLGMLIPGLVAFVFGYFAFRSRVRGVYFSIITQATVVAAVLIFSRNETRLCGTNGLTNFQTLAGFDLGSASVKLGLYFLTVAVVVAVYLISRWIVSSRLGRLMVAVRDNEVRLRFAGYQPVAVKVFAFTVAGVFAAIGWMLYAPQNGIITPYVMAPVESVYMVLWVAIGGRGTLSGAVFGAVLVLYVKSILSSKYPDFWPFLEGGLFIAVVMLIPDGIVGAWRNATRGERGGSQALFDRGDVQMPALGQPSAAAMAAVEAGEAPAKGVRA
ncbi:MAG: urea ABC transporter permease subunit UrtC [Phycisphaerae bacterium]|nr:urea ABC transporter permease subunit UrtC [Tepidisphaeraceae bacterium]